MFLSLRHDASIVHRLTRRAMFLLFPLLVTLGGCAPGEDDATETEGPAGHLEVVAMYAPGGPKADDAQFAVHTAAGEPAAGPTSRTGFELEPGRYTVTARVGEAEGSAETEVRAGQRTELEVILDAGVLDLTAVAVEGGSPLTDARFQILATERDIRGERRSIVGSTSRTSFVLPAGTYLTQVTDDLASAEKEVHVRAGGRTEETIVLDAGVLHARAVEADGAAVSDRLRWEILSVEQDLRGRRETVAGATSRNQFVLPAGEYLLQAQVENRVAQERITIEAGARLEVEIILPPGEAADDD
jgi:Ca-activated chloride channel homolog